jgi:hypothetical protein
MSNTPMPVKLTDEDFAIIVRRMNTSFQNEYAIGDAIDARAMLEFEAGKAVANQPDPWVLSAERAAKEDAEEWRVANEANRRAEGRWEDNGCQPVRDL